jgi:hypothetical protein
MTTERIEAFWQDATADDVARVMKGEAVEARFWGDEHCGKALGLLRGWAQDSPCWNCEHNCGRSYFENCQVYREPSWWTNKPDPGPGWTLLGKFPDEPKLATDEAWDCHLKEWRQTFTNDGDQVKTVWYRRRIGAVESEPLKLDEGSKCPTQGCTGVLRFRPVKDCSCHIRPPCSHCTDNPPCCPVCEWTSGDPIEPVQPGPRHYVLRVGDTVEGPNGDCIRCVEPGFEQGHYALKAGDTVGTPSGQTITITAKGFEVTQ